MRELFEGVNLATFAAGNRRIIKAVKARTTKTAEPKPDPCEHPDHKKKSSHAEHCVDHPAPTPAADAPHPLKAWGPRAAGGVAVLWLFWPTVGRWVPVTLATVVTLWVVVALVAGQQAADGDQAHADTTPAATADASSEADDDQDDEIQEAPADGVLWALIRHVAGLSDQGTAAHLSQVIEEGEKRGLLGGWEVADLREHLANLGVVTVEAKKLTFQKRQRVRMAVLLDALPAADPAPVPAVASSAA